MTLLFSLLRYFVSFMLGALVSAILGGAAERHRWVRKFLCVCAILLAVQLLSFLLLSMEITKKLYPLIVHLPLWALLVLVFQVPMLQTAVSILIAYLCCQVPRWFASLGMLISEDHWIFPIFYIPAAALFLYVFWRYLSHPLRQYLVSSQRNCLQMGLVPALYYLFDYITTIYTNLLHSGNMAAVQFMPSVLSIAFLLFMVLFYNEQEKQRQLMRERDILSVQLNQAKFSFSAIQQIHEQTRQYRHDMRHHISFLQTLAAEDNLGKIQQYLNSVQQDLDSITPVRYCCNETVNLLLSYFASAAKQIHAEYTVFANLPPEVSYSDTELCSILSNGLENAMQAVSQVPLDKEKSVSIHIGMHGESILIQIENTFTGTIHWQDGLPCSNQQDHGLGTQSIRTIARSHGGEAIFREYSGKFQLRILLPNEPK